MKANKIIDRNEIHSGFVIKLRSGHTLTIMRAGNFAKIACSEKGPWTYLSNWDDKLRTKFASYYDRGHDPYMYFVPASSEYDIMEVYGLIEGTDNYCGALSNCIANRPLIWKRSDPVKMTIRQVEDVLGHEVELISET